MAVALLRIEPTLAPTATVECPGRPLSVLETASGEPLIVYDDEDVPSGDGRWVVAVTLSSEPLPGSGWQQLGAVYAFGGVPAVVWCSAEFD